MRFPWLTSLIKPRYYAGIECFEWQGERCFQVSVFSSRAGELHLTDSVRVPSLEDARALIPKITPTILCIHTPSVLTKLMEAPLKGDTEGLVNAAFPNLKMADFHYQVIQTETHPVVSISKKEYVAGLLRECRAAKIDAAGITLGPAALPALLPYCPDGDLMLNAQRVNCRDHQMVDYARITEPIETEYQIGGLALPGKALIGFAGILDSISPAEGLSGFDDLNAELRNEAQQGRWFYLGLRAAVLFFLILLLGNYLVFDRYFRQASEMRAKTDMNETQRTELQAMEQRVQHQEKRWTALQDQGNSKASLYLDLLAKELPAGILWEQVTYQPLEKPVREGKAIAVLDKRMRIIGSSRDHQVFSDWLRNLEHLPWISGVETRGYEQLSRSEAHFEIYITLHEE